MMRKTPVGYRYVAAFLVAMAIANGTTLWKQRFRMVAGYGDFCSFYTAASLMRQGKGKLIYNLQEQWNEQQKFAPNVAIRQGPLPYLRPPFEAVFILPLTFFSYPGALAIWSAVELLLLWLTALILPRPNPFSRIFPAWAEAGLCLGLFPVFLDLVQGQDAILLLFILAATLALLQAEKDACGGIVLALGLFKFHLVAPIAIMVWLAGRRRILRGFLPAAAALVAMSCLISGAGVLSAYPAYVVNLNRVSGVGVIAAYTMPNLRGLLTAVFGSRFYGGPLLWVLLPAAIAAMIFTVRVWKPLIKTGFGGLALGYCLALLTAILTSFYAYSYDMTMLIVPLLLLGGGFLDAPELPFRVRGMVGLGLLLLICTPLYWALFRIDSRSLLVIPMIVLAAGITAVMRLLPATN